MKSKSIRIRVAGVLIENDKILMICHEKNDRKYWLLPGGGVDYGETLPEALYREFLEELGVKVKVHDQLFTFDSISPSGKRHIVNIVFLCSYVNGEYALGDDKRLHDYKFFTAEELFDITVYPSFKQQIVSYIKKENGLGIYLGSRWKK